MTAGEAIARADLLRPNQYSSADKLRWLRRLDGQILEELLRTHEAVGGEAGALAGAVTELPESYDENSVLLAPAPYDEELYSAFLYSQIDLHNAELQKYDQSVTLLAAAWRQLADWLNRARRPRGPRRWRF